MTSRTTLVRMFRADSGRGIAAQVGYDSETAFSRAYARQFTLPPGADRSAAACRTPGMSSRVE